MGRYLVTEDEVFECIDAYIDFTEKKPYMLKLRCAADPDDANIHGIETSEINDKMYFSILTYGRLFFDIKPLQDLFTYALNLVIIESVLDLKENVVVDLNELWKYKPKAFEFNGLDSSGDNACQTPIWIRPRSLMSINKRHAKGLRKDYIQIVGHTQMRKLDIEDSNKFTGGRYYFIDTMDNSGEYLIIEDDKLSTNSVR
jgi:hypothetical protein